MTRCPGSGDPVVSRLCLRVVEYLPQVPDAQIGGTLAELEPRVSE
jgi:hypothetical protein